MSPLTAAKRFLFHIKLSMVYAKLNLASAMEYRLSFVSQALGMFINNFSFLILWWIYFESFPSVNGWTFADSTLLLSVSTANFGLALVFGGGILELASYINRGELDYFLALPKNSLWHLIVSKLHISAIGDLVFGLVIWFAFCPITFESTALYFLAVIISALAFINFMIATQSLAFYFPGFIDGARALFNNLISFSIYPSSTFHGWLKVVMLTVLPGFFIYTLPTGIVRYLNWRALGWLALFWLLSFIFALAIFNAGLKRYESGNLFQVRG